MASEIKVDTVSEKTSGSGVTIDGLLIKDGGISGDVSLIGTTPTFTIGDAGAEDAALVFDGNAQDFYIALDDFGTGYSSLSYLRELPLHKLKIDQALVRDIRSDKNDRVIVETIIAMARLMELDVIAEGVEEEYQLNFLKEKGCYQYQGYYFDKPVPAEVFYDTWVANRNAQQR